MDIALSDGDLTEHGRRFADDLSGEMLAWSGEEARRLARPVADADRDFTGHEELLAALDRRLRQQQVTAVLPQALHGMGGVGKSRVATPYAYAAPRRRRRCGSSRPSSCPRSRAP